jgi:hypothetical protein
MLEIIGSSWGILIPFTKLATKTTETSILAS